MCPTYSFFPSPTVFFAALALLHIRNPISLHPLSCGRSDLNRQKLANPLSANMTPKLTFSAALSCTALRRSTPLTYFCTVLYGMMLMPSCFSAVWRPRKARPRRSARGLEKREIVRPETRPGRRRGC